MALILNIDTSIENASVCIAEDDKPIAVANREGRQDHAAWLHVAIQDLLNQNKIATGTLAAVAVSIGPGSYTGLRLGLSTAKGLCYALGIPLLTISSLKMVAYASSAYDTELICPLIDARRMEVFTAVYDRKYKALLKPQALVIDSNSFSGLLSQHTITFCGNAIQKLQSLITHPHALFSRADSNATHLAYFAFQDFLHKNFADLAYVEPEYLKEFYFNSH
jgi:tRNA threonylcarbamoyladenosine biosynthesis protein TsaB